MATGSNRGDWIRARWRKLQPRPAEGRIFPAVAASRHGLCVASGAALSPGRRYLTDAWQFQFKIGWTPLAELPSPALAAPAMSDSKGRFIIFGGDDGHHANDNPEPGAKHPGFSRSILGLNLKNDSWHRLGELPEGLVTTGIASWRGQFVIPGGENRPGARSTRVLSIPNNFSF